MPQAAGHTVQANFVAKTVMPRPPMLQVLLVVKADVQGSVEAVTKAAMDLASQHVSIRVSGITNKAFLMHG